MSITITGVPQKIVYQNDSFCIYRCQAITSGYGLTFSAKGHVMGSPDSILNQEVSFSGETERNQYGHTISFTNYAVRESEDYFWTNVSGLSKRVSNGVVSKHGKSPDWLDDANASTILQEIPGIKEKTAAKVMERWKEYQGIRKLVEQLAPYGVSQSQIAAIYKHFGDKAGTVIAQNPYRVTEIRGIGFLKADEIAQKVGISERSIERLVAGVEYALQVHANDGNSCVLQQDLFSKVNEILKMSDGSIAFVDISYFVQAMNDFVVGEEDSNVIAVPGSEGIYALKHIYYMEKLIGTVFSGLKEQSQSDLTLSPPLAKLKLSELDSGDIKLGEQQSEAIYQALISVGAFAVAGYAGTGKSTVSKFVLSIIESSFNLSKEDFCCCALSGVAANRIQQQSGYQSKTIHTMLGYDGKGFVFNESNPLPFKVILLDEAGMVDTWLMYSLIKAIDFSTTKLIMLGDPAQLLPIGAGQPFLDLMQTGLVGSVELTKIYRQSDDKAIPLVAQSIRNGEKPSILEHYTDVSFTALHSENDRAGLNNRILEGVLTMATENRWQGTLPQTDEEIWKYISDFQVITPRKSGPLGQEELNKYLKSKLIPMRNTPVLFRDFNPMTLMDKVIHLKNTNMKVKGFDEPVRIYNGQLGVITVIDKENQTVTVRYPLNKQTVVYEEKHVRQGILGLSWALTIHKTQGAEFSKVVIPLTMSHFKMLNNKLLYTGVTRAKEDLQLIGEVRALDYASTNNESIQRRTVLPLAS